jgi:acyl-CoA synthetase (AMP-forming)/AMP-acid ligase II
MAIDVTSLVDRRANNRWDRCSVGDIFERVAIVTPDAEAIVGAPGAFADAELSRVTYAVADQLANRFANRLLDLGLCRGDRVMFICDNSVEGYIAKIGVVKAGGVCVPINPRQASDFVAYAADLTEPRFTVADAAFLSVARARNVLVDVTIPIGSKDIEGASFEEFCAGGSMDAPEITIHGDDVWQILFTSGTTSMPKGVMISHNYTYMTAMSWALSQTRGLRHESFLRAACFMPIMFHIGDQGYSMPSLFVAGTLILGRSMRPETIAETIVSEQATMLAAIPTEGPYALLEALARQGRGPLALTCLLGAVRPYDSQAPEIMRRWKAMAPDVDFLYLAGQTESTAGHRLMLSAFPDQLADAQLRGVNIVGRPAPIMVSQVVNVDGGTIPLPHGVMGELLYRSPAMMSGYYRDEEATRAAFDGGWFHTGDLATAKPSGERILSGRSKDMIKTGGENVAALRVEAVVMAHPSVARVAVVGLPDDRWGEMVTAVVVPTPGATIDEDDVINFCRSRLAGFETPKRVIVRDLLPLDFSGAKVLKSELKKQLTAQLASSDSQEG